MERMLAYAAHQHMEFSRRLRAIDPTLDEETLADTVEGLTNLHEIIAAIVRSALNDEALAAGLKGRVQEMEDRLNRLEERASARRQIAREVMVEANIKRILEPDFTISIRPGSPSLLVIDEVAIPERFWEQREPRLNRQDLLSDLKTGVKISGVALSNPGPVLSVRTK